MGTAGEGEGKCAGLLVSESPLENSVLYLGFFFLLSSCLIKRHLLIRLGFLIRLQLIRRRAPLSLRLLPQPRALPAALSLSHRLAPRLPPVCLYPHTPLTILLWIRQVQNPICRLRL
jgi:hypothetical protein